MNEENKCKLDNPEVSGTYTKWLRDENNKQFEQRCWELFVSLCGGDTETTYDVHLLDAIETVQKVERKMKEMREGKE